MENQRWYLIEEERLRKLIDNSASFLAVTPPGSFSNPFVQHSLEHTYPYACREGEGIYWDILEDKFIDSYLSDQSLKRCDE